MKLRSERLKFVRPGGAKLGSLALNYYLPVVRSTPGLANPIAIPFNTGACGINGFEREAGPARKAIMGEVLRSAQHFLAVVSCLLLASPDSLSDGIRAFPDARGAGANSRGGRGGAVLFVTNLHDSGTGSFRAAVESQGPRIVIFRVSGYIDLESPVRVSQPFLTIAGHTAPGDGICLKNFSLQIANTKHVIVRHLRCRPGDKTSKPGEMDAITVWDSQHIILDHCSATWSTDECLSVTRDSDHVTVQWCLIAEALTSHSMGSIIGADRGRISFLNNLYANNRSRNPRPSAPFVQEGQTEFTGPRIDFRNNVVYNWSYTAGYVGGSDPQLKEFTRVNLVGNYYRPGPDTRPGREREVFRINPGAITELFISGNSLHGFPKETANNGLLVKHTGGVLKKQLHPHVLPPVPTESAKLCYSRVLDRAGAVLPARDAVDRRIVAGVRDGTGRLLGSQDQVRGWLPLARAAATPDNDEDGQPDVWERKFGLDPREPADGRADPDQDGYDNLEEFLNGTSPHSADR